MNGDYQRIIDSVLGILFPAVSLLGIRDLPLRDKFTNESYFTRDRITESPNVRRAQLYEPPVNGLPRKIYGSSRRVTSS